MFFSVRLFPDAARFRAILVDRFGLSDRLLVCESTDVADRLAQSLLILDQCYPHIVFAVFAERPTGSDGHFRVLHQVHGVINATLAF